MIGENDIPSLVERIVDRRDSLKNDGYKMRKISAHINLEFAGSANAYFVDGKFDEASFKMNRVRLEIYGKLHDRLSYAQACVEWFPFEIDKGFKVFAHYVYKGHELSQNAKALGAYLPHTQRVSLGIQYIIPVL